MITSFQKLILALKDLGPANAEGKGRVMFLVCSGGGLIRELSFAERVGIISSVGVEKGGS